MRLTMSCCCCCYATTSNAMLASTLLFVFDCHCAASANLIKKRLPTLILLFTTLLMAVGLVSLPHQPLSLHRIALLCFASVITTHSMQCKHHLMHGSFNVLQWCSITISISLFYLLILGGQTLAYEPLCPGASPSCYSSKWHCIVATLHCSVAW